MLSTVNLVVACWKWCNCPV